METKIAIRLNIFDTEDFLLDPKIKYMRRFMEDFALGGKLKFY